MNKQRGSGGLPFWPFNRRGPVVGVVRLAGVISTSGPLRRGGLSLSGLADTLEKAFKLKRLGAVALAINSPGGSPVQSALIAKRIRDLAGEHDVPVVAFVEDVAASGGYWLALAADEIFVQPASIVGSIGVITAGFGFPELLERWGVERRVHASGERKGMLDPFKAENQDDIDRLKAIQADIHETFKHIVRTRRGKRLKGGEGDLFSGEFWTGQKAIDLGLADGIGDIRSVMRDRFGERVRLRLIGRRQSWLARKLGGAASLPEMGGFADWPAQALASIEDRLAWHRFGL